jgi:serine/threonine-protein kinase HSL1 (negative regulator of Swe1 kinase)
MKDPFRQSSIHIFTGTRLLSNRASRLTCACNHLPPADNQSFRHCIFRVLGNAFIKIIRPRSYIMDHHHRASTRRAPLGEATRRVNNELPQTPSKISTPRQHERQKPDLPQVKAYRPPSPARYNDYDSLRDYNQPGPLRPNPENPRLSAISKEHDATNSRRDSLFSTTSTESSRVKVYIGPWRLGKTLGEGATARVRLAKHASTGQWAAVKIVQKRYAQLSQASSLADLDQSEALRPDAGDGLRRMPVGIEREVAIMKLIQHPNIMKLYDIWENRKEM